MKSIRFIFIYLFLVLNLSYGQPVKEPPTTFRILYIDRPFTEEESKSIEKGILSSVTNLHFFSEAPTPQGKEAKVEFSIMRNQLSATHTYQGTRPLILHLSSAGSPQVASIPVPKNGGGDILIILKPSQPGVLENAATVIINNSVKEFPEGNLCIINVTGVRLAFQTSGSNLILNADEKKVFVPNKRRMNSVPITIVADVKPAPRTIYEGILRLSEKDRIMFLAYTPPGDASIFRTDFFMLQPAFSSSTP